MVLVHTCYTPTSPVGACTAADRRACLVVRHPTVSVTNLVAGEASMLRFVSLGGCPRVLGRIEDLPGWRRGRGSTTDEPGAEEEGDLPLRSVRCILKGGIGENLSGWGDRTVLLARYGREYTPKGNDGGERDAHVGCMTRRGSIRSIGPFL